MQGQIEESKVSKQTQTTAQLCALLQISRKTLYLWVITGKIPPPLKIGRTVRWPADLVTKLLAGQVPPPARV